MGKRILVVDTDPIFLGQTVPRLREWGYEVETAPSPRRARRMIRFRGKYDLVLLGMCIGDQITSSVAQAAKGKNPDTKIMATTFDLNRLAQEAEKMGADAAIGKAWPDFEDRLAREINRLLPA